MLKSLTIILVMVQLVELASGTFFKSEENCNGNCNHVKLVKHGKEIVAIPVPCELGHLSNKLSKDNFHECDGKDCDCHSFSKKHKNHRKKCHRCHHNQRCHHDFEEIPVKKFGKINKISEFKNELFDDCNEHKIDDVVQKFDCEKKTLPCFDCEKLALPAIELPKLDLSRACNCIKTFMDKKARIHCEKMNCLHSILAPLKFPKLGFGGCDCGCES